ncbi:surface lipoprotein assembly modifier [Acinetobacter sp. c1-l78]|uniref:surface lipoprotein assembly modifier n=1 Tax=Acinetobacter sp. c1-l78 TaxID=3342803 RepID=UPI0035B8700F
MLKIAFFKTYKINSNSIPTDSKEIATTNTSNTAIHVDAKTLLAQPELLQQVFFSSLYQQNSDALIELLPLYQQLPDADKISIKYARALIARQEKNYKKAIDLYRDILSENADLSNIRMQLAIVLLDDKQLGIAAEQFSKVLADKNTPDAARQDIEKYMSWIKQQSKWMVNTRLRYINDENINRIPKQRQYGFWQLDAPQSAQGFAYGFALTKNQNLFGNWSLRPQVYLDGKSHWNNHTFDDITVSTSLALINSDAKKEWSVAPIYEKRWFATQAFSDKASLRGQFFYRLNPTLYSSNYIQYGEKNISNDIFWMDVANSLVHLYAILLHHNKHYKSV